MLDLVETIKNGMNAIRAANLERDRVHYKALLQHGYEDESWEPNDWLTALTGEVGELANILKKVRRGDFTLEAARPMIGRELADVLTQLDLLAEACGGFDLGDLFVKKFNEVSERVGCDVRID